MNPRDLALAALAGEDLSVRQWVKDALRQRLDFSRLSAPEGLAPDELAVAAGMVELLAQRSGQAAPSWTRGCGRANAPVYLVKMPALRQTCEQRGPAVLRERNVFALPDYLKAL